MQKQNHTYGELLENKKFTSFYSSNFAYKVDNKFVKPYHSS